MVKRYELKRCRTIGKGIKIFCALYFALGASGAEPWRLGEALGLPDWLELSGSQRLRYENVDGQFRSGGSGGDQILALRTTLAIGIRSERLGLTTELMDSRQEMADAGTPLGTGMVNAAELIQAKLELDLSDWVSRGTSSLELGRFTLDLGSRRMVARNRYRNTTNAFTGVLARWQGRDGASVDAFYAMPLQRLPGDRQSLLDNDVQMDEERAAVRFWGVYGATPKLALDSQFDLFVFGLQEDDASGLATRNRELLTFGFRWHRKPTRGTWDFELESAYQVGESRASGSPADLTDLNHQADFQHFEVGYTLDHAWATRLAVQIDYASGDENPTDGENNRFDTLYGARRFDFGPTGIYGAFARSNVVSPGLRVTFRPTERWQAMLAHRGYWLASNRDAWTAAGVRDLTGGADRFVGQQAELRVRWDLFPKNLQVEFGLAHLFGGGFADDAPNASGGGDATCAYLQTVLTF